MNILANILTAFSLTCGFLSIILSLQHHFTFSCWAILLSVIFDGLDGQVARRNPLPSEFGREFDSLVDVISFGAAPAILGYIFICMDFYIFAAFTLLLYLLASVFRLAKYNITPKEKLANYFYGLPTTASGGILASFILVFISKQTVLLPRYVPAVFLFLVLMLSFLMVSKARYLNLDGLKQLLGKRWKVTAFLITILLIIDVFFGMAGMSIFSLFLIYLIFSPFVVKRLDSAQ